MADTVKSFVALLSILLVLVSTAGANRKDPGKLKAKDRTVNPVMDSITKNISALWHEVELLQQPVHIHIHGEGEVMKGHGPHGHGPQGHGPESHGPLPGWQPVGKHRHGTDDDEDDDDKKKDKKDGKKEQGPQLPGRDHTMGPGRKEAPRHEHYHPTHDQDHDHGHGHGHDDDIHHDWHGTHVHIHLHTGEEERRPHKEAPQDYVNARCDVAVNSALPKGEQQPIQGVIYFRQKPFQELEVSVNITGIKVTHDGKEARDHSHLRGLHVHEFADMSQGCNSMGGHFNPTGVVHGSPDSSQRHIGDWGNLEVSEQGAAVIKFNDTVASLLGFHTILGRGIVVHSGVDDLGQGGTEASLKTGNAGGRIACCVIAAAAAAPDVWG